MRRDLCFVYSLFFSRTIPLFGCPNFQRTRMAANPTRWQSSPNAATPRSSSASGSISNSHPRYDAQFINFNPLPTNTAVTPVAHEDSRSLGSQLNLPSDQCQFQLTQQQALSQAQQQRPTRTASSASFSPSTRNPTGAFSKNLVSRSNTASSGCGLQCAGVGLGFLRRHALCCSLLKGDEERYVSSKGSTHHMRHK